ncbi:hypothetical protein [Risungbinella massiliensis]|uniref:hypothetical protein n=1 Tax=Risungbinella massiliensis TaxID=1329796 RepID=UPI0005CC64EF|nr:hypothetical protein [Risungbinella massiliensis]
MRKRKRHRKNKQLLEETSSNSVEQKLEGNFFTSAIFQPELLVGLGLVGLYVFTYAYYLGYYHFYKIPIMYLDLNLTKLTIPSFSFIIIIFGFFIPNYILYRFKSDYKNNPRLKRKRVIITMVLLMIILVPLILTFFLKLLGYFQNIQVNSPIDVQLSTIYFVCIITTFYYSYDIDKFKRSKTYRGLGIFFIIILLFFAAYSLGASSTL